MKTMFAIGNLHREFLRQIAIPPMLMPKAPEARSEHAARYLHENYYRGRLKAPKKATS